MENLNPLLCEWETPFANAPFDEICPEHFLPALKESIDSYDKEIECIVSNSDEPTFENTVLAFEKAGNLFSRIIFYKNRLSKESLTSLPCL